VTPASIGGIAGTRPILRILTPQGLLITQAESQVVPKSGSASGPPPEATSATVITRSPRSANPIVTELGPNELEQSLGVPDDPGSQTYIYYHNDAGALVGVGDVTQDAKGKNVVYTPNNVAPKILSASNGLRVDDGVVIKDATLTLVTGVADGLPGVDHVDVVLSGPAYAGGGATATIASFKAPKLAQYDWAPLEGSPGYDASLLVDGPKPVAFTLTTKAYEAGGMLVGIGKLGAGFVDAANVEFTVDPTI
jgi:hypothetical protein